MALPPLELFSLEEEAALLPGGLFVFPMRLYNPKRLVQKEYADVAQLVEQLIRNQQVIGSSPIVGSIGSVPNPKRCKRFLSLFRHRVWYLLIHCFFLSSLAVEFSPSA